MVFLPKSLAVLAVAFSPFVSSVEVSLHTARMLVRMEEDDKASSRSVDKARAQRARSGGAHRELKPGSEELPVDVAESESAHGAHGGGVEEEADKLSIEEAHAMVLEEVKKQSIPQYIEKLKSETCQEAWGDTYKKHFPIKDMTGWDCWRAHTRLDFVVAAEEETLGEGKPKLSEEISACFGNPQCKHEELINNALWDVLSKENGVTLEDVMGAIGGLAEHKEKMAADDEEYFKGVYVSYIIEEHMTSVLEEIHDTLVEGAIDEHKKSKKK